MLNWIRRILHAIFSGNDTSTHVDNTEYPDFVEYPNEITIPLPGITADTLMYVFPMKGDYDKLLQVCNQRLNQVIKDQSIQYFPLTDHLIGVMSHIHKGYKAEKDYPKPGYASEKAFQLFMPIAECTKNAAGKWVAQRMAMFVPYILLDNPFNLATGREEIGFPNSSAQVNIPEDPHQADHLQLNAFGFKHFNHENPEYGAYQPWLIINQINKPATPPPTDTWKTHQEAWQAVKDTFEMIPRPEMHFRLPFIIHELEDLIAKRVDMIFLKQLRDSAQPSKACYQAVVESPGVVQHFQKGWWLHGEYEMLFQDFDSFPIKEELGLPDRIEVKTAFWCVLDMLFPPGREVYKAS